MKIRGKKIKSVHLQRKLKQLCGEIFLQKLEKQSFIFTRVNFSTVKSVVHHLTMIWKITFKIFMNDVAEEMILWSDWSCGVSR